MSYEYHNSIEDVELHDADEHDKEEFITDNKSSLCCELCNVKVTSTKILQRHIEGRKHKMKVERQGKIFACELCEVVTNSEKQLNIHLTSSKHKNRLLKKDHPEYSRIPTTSSNFWIIFFFIVCIFINLLLLFKLICD